MELRLTVITIFFTLCVINETNGLFRHGRMHDGFVGVSRDSGLRIDNTVFPDLWFRDQLLDHFDHTSELKWNQVIIVFIIIDKKEKRIDEYCVNYRDTM